jgi:hypothetical protein
LSDHFDAEDSRTDLTDLYVFPSPSRVDCSVLILDFNPDATAAETSFDPAASYEIKIDTDGDLEADVAFHVLFETMADDEARATVYHATGVAARGTGRVGKPVVVGARVPRDGSAGTTRSNGYSFFAGLRSDPHFKDVKGLRNNFQFTGDDPIARRNVFGVALEAPNEALGGGSVRLWARAMTIVDGELRQVDQAGRPGINNTFNGPEADRLAFDETPPTEQWARFGDRFVAFLGSLGYPEREARELARGFLPDVLEYRVSEPAGYPNGRRLTDDTADLIVSLLTRGRITSDLVGPHTDLLPDFPYLGLPHPPEEAAIHVD